MRTLLILMAMFCTGCSHEPSAEIKARAAELSSGFRQHAETITAKQDESLTLLTQVNSRVGDLLLAADATKEQIETLKASLANPQAQQSGGDPAAPEPQETERKSQTTPLLSNSPPAVRLFITSSEQAPDPFPCAPCERLLRAIDAGEFAGFEIVWSAPFDGQRGYPATRFRSRTSPTGWRVIYGFNDSTIAQIKANLDGTARSEVMTGPLTGAFFQYPKDSAILSQRSDLRSDNRSDRRRRRPVNSAFAWLIPSAANQW
jgi:hypothetical protein